VLFQFQLQLIETTLEPIPDHNYTFDLCRPIAVVSWQSGIFLHLFFPSSTASSSLPTALHGNEFNLRQRRDRVTVPSVCESYIPQEYQTYRHTLIHIQAAGASYSHQNSPPSTNTRSRATRLRRTFFAKSKRRLYRQRQIWCTGRARRGNVAPSDVTG